MASYCIGNKSKTSHSWFGRKYSKFLQNIGFQIDLHDRLLNPLKPTTCLPELFGPMKNTASYYLDT